MRKPRLDRLGVIRDIACADRRHMVLARRHAVNFPELGPNTARRRWTTTLLRRNVPMGKQQWRSRDMVSEQVYNPKHLVLRLPKKKDRY